MQNTQRNAYKTGTRRLITRALALMVLGLGLQACQTTRPLTADEWNARTNAVQAFTNSVNAYTASQRPVYGPGQAYRPPTQQNVFQGQPASFNNQEQPLFGPNSMFGQ